MTREIQVVRTETVGEVAVILINNPPVNAASHSVRAGLAEAVASAGSDPKVRAILIACEGKMFVSGADIREFGQPRLPPLMPEITFLIEALDKPVVAAMHGSALGVGFELALACHYRIAAAGTKVGLPEVKLGLIPGAGGTQRLPRLIGLSAALDMITSGRTIDTAAVEAQAIFDVIIDSGSIVDAGVVYCENLLERGMGPRRSRDIDVDPATDSDAAVAALLKAAGSKFRSLHAPFAAIEAVKAAMRPIGEGLAIEHALFARLESDSQASALRYAFFAERDAAKVPGIPPSRQAADIVTAGVVGGGTMGIGIAMAFADAGVPVQLIDIDAAAADRARERIEKTYMSLVNRGRLSQAAAGERLRLISAGCDLSALENSDLVIEAVFEDLTVKQDLFRRLSEIVKAEAILATNTSYLDVNEIAAVVTGPERFIGLHFFSPANIMKLLEIIRPDKTSPEVISRAMKLAQRIGKTAVVVGNGYGFVGNRMLSPRQREANRLIVEGASPEQVDRVLEGFGFLMGPFAMADMAGLDIGMTPSRRLEMPIRAALVDAGRFGQKNGGGFYDYSSARERHSSPLTEELTVKYARAQGIERRNIDDAEILERCLYPLISEGARILDEGKAIRASDIDVIWINGYAWPKWTGGPMYYADSIGLKTVVQVLDRYAAACGDGFEAGQLLRRLAAEDGKLSTFGSE